jgi:hypothetical protein
MKDTCDLVLFTGTHCHLCVEARNLILPVLPSGVKLKEINIADSPQWQTRYATTIPVLALLDNSSVVMEEKGWPFSQGQVKRFIAKVTSPTQSP